MTFHRCPLCLSSLPGLLLEAHLKAHLGYASHRCLRCPVSFHSLADAAAHFRGRFPAHPGEALEVAEVRDAEKEAELERLMREAAPGMERGLSWRFQELAGEGGEIITPAGLMQSGEMECRGSTAAGQTPEESEPKLQRAPSLDRLADESSHLLSPASLGPCVERVQKQSKEPFTDASPVQGNSEPLTLRASSLETMLRRATQLSLSSSGDGAGPPEAANQPSCESSDADQWSVVASEEVAAEEQDTLVEEEEEEEANASFVQERGCDSGSPSVLPTKETTKEAAMFWTLESQRVVCGDCELSRPLQSRPVPLCREGLLDHIAMTHGSDSNLRSGDNCPMRKNDDAVFKLMAGLFGDAVADLACLTQDHRCAKCQGALGRKLHSPFQLLQHVSVHSSEVIWACTSCAFVSRRLQTTEMEVHLMAKHDVRLGRDTVRCRKGQLKGHFERLVRECFGVQLELELDD